MPKSLLSGLATKLADVNWWKPYLTGIYVDGVEVTQAIQYRRAADHLTDPADRGPDNSIGLVADKAAYVRIYVRALFSDVGNVRGTVTIQRLRYGLWVDAGTLTQQFPAAVTAASDPAYATERGSLSNSLNFVIPAAMMRGWFRLKAHVWVPGQSRYQSDSTVECSAGLLQTLKVRAIPVHYSGRDNSGTQVVLPAPSLGDLQTTVARTLQMWPVSQTPDLSLAGQMNWFVPLDGAIVAGSCPSSWNSILAWLALVKLADGNLPGCLYYGLLPAAIPTGGAGGCGGGGSGVGAGRVGGGTTMAHELGHVLGFGHAPCGLSAGDMGDPNYPAYEPYDTNSAKTASIGEYGLDLSGPTVLSPAFGKDLMSYCNPRWISIYHYQQLLQNEALNPRWLPGPLGTHPPNVEVELDSPIPHHIPDPQPPWVGTQIHPLEQVAPIRLLSVTGVLVDGRIEVEHVLTLDTTPIAAGNRLPGTTLEMLDTNGTVLAKAPVQLVRTQSCGSCGGGCGGGGSDEQPAGVVQALLPDPPTGTTLRIVRDDEEVWVRRAPGERPRVDDLRADVDGDELRLRWQESVDSDEALRVLRWSPDEGRSWQSLSVGLAGEEAALPVTLLPAGSALLHLLVSDGFETSVSDPVRVDVPRRAPQASILAPAAGGTVRSGSLVRLWGLAVGADGRPLADDQLHWELDGRQVASGSEAWAELMDFEGDHRCTLVAVDGNQRTEVTSDFWASADGRAPYRRQARD